MRLAMTDTRLVNPYAAFRFEAVVDWVEVRVTLPEPSQPRHVRARMPAHWGLPYVKAETDDPSYTTRVFTFKVQDPNGPSQFMNDVQALVKPGQSPLTESEVEIVGIEIAFDAYSIDHDRAALVDMTEAMLWRQTLWASHPRITSPLGSNGVATTAKARRGIEEGWTHNAGDADGELAQRWYLKSYDTQPGEPFIALPIAEHRARSEVTLRGVRRPFTTMAGWRECQFETLRTPYFSWRVGENAAGLVDTMPEWVRAFPSLGLIDGSERRRKDRRKTRSGTRPDSTLQQAAKNALERLTRQQRRG